MRTSTLLVLSVAGLLPLPAESQVSEPQNVFSRPTLEREQTQETIEAKRREELERRRLGKLPEAELRKRDQRVKLQRLQQRHLQERQRLEQQALQRRLRSIPQPGAEVRQRSQAQRFKRDAQEQQLRRKIQRSTWRSRGTQPSGRGRASGFSRPTTPGFPRSRLQVR